MYKYEKIEYDNNLPTKLHDFFVENSSGVPVDKHWHRGIEIIVPLYGTFNLWINGDMVRIIAGTLTEVGLGKLSGDDIIGIIEARDRSRAGHTAPPYGLYLTEVYYSRSDF